MDARRPRARADGDSAAPAATASSNAAAAGDPRRTRSRQRRRRSRTSVTPSLGDSVVSDHEDEAAQQSARFSRLPPLNLPGSTNFSFSNPDAPQLAWAGTIEVSPEDLADQPAPEQQHLRASTRRNQTVLSPDIVPQHRQPLRSPSHAQPRSPQPLQFYDPHQTQQQGQSVPQTLRQTQTFTQTQTQGQPQPLAQSQTQTLQHAPGLATNRGFQPAATSTARSPPPFSPANTTVFVDAGKRFVEVEPKLPRSLRLQPKQEQVEPEEKDIPQLFAFTLVPVHVAPVFLLGFALAQFVTQHALDTGNQEFVTTYSNVALSLASGLFLLLGVTFCHIGNKFEVELQAPHGGQFTWLLSALIAVIVALVLSVVAADVDVRFEYFGHDPTAWSSYGDLDEYRRITVVRFTAIIACILFLHADAIVNQGRRRSRVGGDDVVQLQPATTA